MSLLKKAYLACLKISKIFSRKDLDALLSENCSGNLGDILFVGSGGALESSIRDKMYTSFKSIDIDPERNPDILMSVNDLRFPQKSFDTVFLLEVLEHIPDFYNVPNSISRVIKPGGLVIVSTPFILGEHDLPNDYYRVTVNGLKYLFRDYEQILVSKRTGYSWSILTIISRLIVSNSYSIKLIAMLVNVFLIPLIPVSILVDKILPDTLYTGSFAVFKSKK